MHWSRGWGHAAAAVTVVMVAGCTAMRVNSFAERGTDFARVRTYVWAPATDLATGDPRLDNSPFFQRRLQSGVEARLAARGYQKAMDGIPADVEIHYHASVTQQISVGGLDTDSPQCEPSAPCAPIVYDKGSLVLDLVDVSSKKLIWRGWASTSLDNVIDNQRALEETIDDAVRRILERLPRRGA